MQQLLVSMETSQGPFFLFLACLCVEEKAVRGQEEMEAFRERGQSGSLIACLCEQGKVGEKVDSGE